MLMVCKGRNTRISLMVKKEIWPDVVSFVRKYGLTYEFEHAASDQWVCIGDIHEEKGKNWSEFPRLVRNLEISFGLEKIYILINGKEKEKKHVRKDRKKAGARGKRGNPGKAGLPAGHGPDAGLGGADDRRGSAAVPPPWVEEAETSCDDRDPQSSPQAVIYADGGVYDEDIVPDLTEDDFYTCGYCGESVRVSEMDMNEHDIPAYCPHCGHCDWNRVMKGE